MTLVFQFYIRKIGLTTTYHFDKIGLVTLCSEILRCTLEEADVLPSKSRLQKEEFAGHSRRNEMRAAKSTQYPAA